MSDSSRSPSRGQITRARILASAERHFSERGFANASLEDIAAELGLREAADQEDVDSRALQRLGGPIIAMFRDAFEQGEKEGSLVADYEAGVLAVHGNLLGVDHASSRRRP